MEIQGFSLVNEEKVERAIHGTVSRGGQPSGGLDAMVRNGGLDESDKEAYETALLAEYDRLGGYILKDGLKVQTGAFWNFLNKKPQESPKVKYVQEVDGEIMELDEEEAVVLKKVQEKKQSIVEKKKKKAKKE